MGDGAFVDLFAVTDEFGFGVAGDFAVGDVRARNVAAARNLDDLTHFGVSDDLLFKLGLDMTANHFLHVFDEVVDDFVGFERDALALCRLFHAARRIDAKRHHGGVGGACQKQIALGGCAHAGEHDFQIDFFDLFGFAQQDAANGF